MWDRPEEVTKIICWNQTWYQKISFLKYYHYILQFPYYIWLVLNLMPYLTPLAIYILLKFHCDFTIIASSAETSLWELGKQQSSEVEPYNLKANIWTKQEHSNPILLNRSREEECVLGLSLSRTSTLPLNHFGVWADHYRNEPRT